jgi:hypothetical protein
MVAKWGINTSLLVEELENGCLLKSYSHYLLRSNCVELHRSKTSTPKFSSVILESLLVEVCL